MNSMKQPLLPIAYDLPEPRTRQEFIYHDMMLEIKVILDRIEAIRADTTAALMLRREAERLVKSAEEYRHATTLFANEATMAAMRSLADRHVRLEETSRKTEAHLGNAANELCQAAKSLSWRWTAKLSLASLAILASVWLTSFLAINWYESKLDRLQSQIDAGQAAVASLDKKGGQAVLNHCDSPGKPNRLCVRIDKQAGVFGNSLDYYIIDGY